MGNSQEVIRRPRELNPRPRPRARGVPARRRTLLQAGADLVFSGEGEVALALTEAILQRLGATPEQIDRERAGPTTSCSAPESPVHRATYVAAYDACYLGAGSLATFFPVASFIVLTSVLAYQASIDPGFRASRVALIVGEAWLSNRGQDTAAAARAVRAARVRAHPDGLT